MVFMTPSSMRVARSQFVEVDDVLLVALQCVIAHGSVNQCRSLFRPKRPFDRRCAIVSSSHSRQSDHGLPTGILKCRRMAVPAIGHEGRCAPSLEVAVMRRTGAARVVFEVSAARHGHLGAQSASWRSHMRALRPQPTAT